MPTEAVRLSDARKTRQGRLNKVEGSGERLETGKRERGEEREKGGGGTDWRGGQR